MNYVVIELQTTAEGITSTIVTTYENKEQAESKYYTILSFAALSNLFIHGASIIMADGTPYMHYSYRRDEVFNNANTPEPIEAEGE